MPKYTDIVFNEENPTGKYYSFDELEVNNAGVFADMLPLGSYSYEIEIESWFEVCYAKTFSEGANGKIHQWHVIDDSKVPEQYKAMLLLLL